MVSGDVTLSSRAEHHLTPPSYTHTAKNICLAGVKSVTLYDPAPVELHDLGTQFFLRPEDVGKPRAQATAPRLAELNAYVPVRVLEEPSLTPEVLARFQVSTRRRSTAKASANAHTFTLPLSLRPSL